MAGYEGVIRVGDYEPAYKGEHPPLDPPPNDSYSPRIVGGLCIRPNYIVPCEKLSGSDLDKAHELFDLITDYFDLFPQKIHDIVVETRGRFGNQDVSLASILSSRQYGTGLAGVDRKTRQRLMFKCPARYEGKHDGIAMRMEFVLVVYDDRVAIYGKSDSDSLKIVEEQSTGFPVQDELAAAEFMLDTQKMIWAEMNKRDFKVEDRGRIIGAPKAPKDRLIELIVGAAKAAGVVLPETATRQNTLF
jgi:hypothetical protein